MRPAKKKLAKKFSRRRSESPVAKELIFWTLQNESKRVTSVYVMLYHIRRVESQSKESKESRHTPTPSILQLQAERTKQTDQANRPIEGELMWIAQVTVRKLLLVRLTVCKSHRATGRSSIETNLKAACNIGSFWNRRVSIALPEHNGQVWVTNSWSSRRKGTQAIREQKKAEDSHHMDARARGHL